MAMLTWPHPHSSSLLGPSWGRRVAGGWDLGASRALALALGKTRLAHMQNVVTAPPAAGARLPQARED